MKQTQTFKMLLSAFLVFIQHTVLAQFNFQYQHNANEDHTSLVSSISRSGYVQAGSQQVAGNWDVHLMKIDAAGNPGVDVTLSTPNNEHALHIVQGNNNSYIICGYEKIGVYDRGFVMSVDTNFNLINKTIINVTLNNKHTPALNVMNSAFYLQPNNNLYFPGNPGGGYLITGFEAVGYNATDSKSGYAIKVDNNLTIQWAKKFDSPITAGQPDWDMCSSASWFWSGAYGYFIGGSGTTPALEQCGMAALLSTSGSVVWKELYSDNNVAGTSCVSADCAYDDAEAELYHLTNFSGPQCGGITAFDQTTGAINNSRTRYLQTGYSSDHYTYEFGATCAGNEVLISGYGHNQTNNSITGTFPFILRYDKNTPAVNIWGAHYELTVPSVNYNPNTTIFDIYQAGDHPRVYYPKLYAQRNTNEIVLGAFEDNGTFSENKIIRTDFVGKDSCGYFDPLFVPLSHQTYLFPVDTVNATYVFSPSSPVQNPLMPNPIPCQLCPANVNFTHTNIGCTYTFTATSPSNLCAFWTIKDVSNNIIFTSPGINLTYVFLVNGTYTICFADCAPDINGLICRNEKCETIVVNCVPPCGIMNADFSYTINGCCVTFSDNTPDGDPNGCESWTFGTITSILQGDNITFCFPGSGTYNVCHNDCCYDTFSGTFIYHQVCKTVTVNCTPPCCLPTDFLISSGVGGPCCFVFNPNPSGCIPYGFWWDFGDGNTSTSANPSHCYNKNGIYTVCMTAYCGKFNSITICKSIKVKCIILPPPCCIGTSKFGYSASGNMLSMTDASDIPLGLTITSMEWSWGDGTASTGTTAEHYYPISGSYVVTHTITGTNADGPFSDSNSQTITVHLAPPCTCPPIDPLVFAASPLQCTATNHSTCLKMLDWEGEAGTIHQWMESSTSGGPYTEIPNAIGQQVWVSGIDGPKYFVCRSMSDLTGAYTISEELAIDDQHFAVTVTASATEVCNGASVTLTASPPDGEYYEWEPYTSSTNVLVYTAVYTGGEPDHNCSFVRANSGCGAEGFIDIVVNPCTVPGNDGFSSAASVNTSGVAYPVGNCFNGTLAFANVSPEGTAANVLPGGGQDVWYAIVAPSSALRAVATSATVDIVLELHDALGNQVDMENDVSGTGMESMNTNGLTVGATYYVAVRSYDGVLGTYNVCIQSLTQSFCNDGSGSYDLCTNFKAKWTGANSYTYHFTPTGITPGVPTSTTGGGQIPLSNAALALRHAGTYSVTIDATYSLPDGELMTVTGTTVCNITINPHASVEVKLVQRCPATLLKSTVVQAKPFVCGALNFTVEFTELNACAGTPIGLPFTANTLGASSTINLATVPGVLSGGHWYQLRWRPNFGYGPGAYGNPRVIFVGGSAMDLDEISSSSMNAAREIEVTPYASIYPNPNKGEMLNINLTGIESNEVYVRVMDSMGKLIYQNKYMVDGSLNTIVVFEQKLASGLYLVEFIANENIITERMMVEK